MPVVRARDVLMHILRFCQVTLDRMFLVAGRTEHFEVVVDMRNGGQQTVSFNSPPEVAVGDRVRLTNGSLVRER